MPIFSSNRVSYGGTTVAADTRYTEKDFGRIMSECASNDMKVFNAALARDFKEIEAMQEGTMLESELQAFQEFSVKEAWKSLKEKLKKLWTKIKGVFKNVYAKLTLWLVRDNKTYIAMHRKELLAKNCSNCKCPKFRDAKSKEAISNAGDITATKFKGLIDKISDFDVSKISNNDYVAELDNEAKKSISSSLNVSFDADKSVTSDEIYDAALKNLFKEPDDSLTFGKSVYGGNVNTLLDNLSTNSTVLKNLKKANKTIDKKFKAMIDKLNKAEQKASDSKNEEEKSKSSMYKSCSELTSKFQTYMNAVVSAQIRLSKFMIKNDRGLIATLVAYNPKAVNDAAMLESAYMEGFDRFFFEAEEETPEEVEADAEELKIDIDISGGDNVDVEVNDDTDDD